MSRALLRSFVVSGVSMSPALRDGDRFLGWRPGSSRRFRRGSIVAFIHPARPGFWLVKRVVGLSGEVITIDTGEVLINGKSGVDRWGDGWSAPDGEWRIPDGELFVLSDQRPLTRDDSRGFGPIGAANLYRMVFPPRTRRTRPPIPGAARMDD